MEKIMILNGSPRAPRSNSKQYAALFEKYSRLPTETFSVTGPKAGEIGKKSRNFPMCCWYFLYMPTAFLCRCCAF